MSIWFEGLKEFWKRYKTVWTNVWSIREQLDPPKRGEEERAFLPAHLELTETPVSAVPKWTARLIIAFFFITLAWSIFGHMDIVASAQGKTILSGRSKVIQSLEDSSVVGIYVQDGQRVKKGDRLVKLQLAGADEDFSKGHKAYIAAKLTELRSEALLKAVEYVVVPQMPKDDAELSVEEIEEAERLIVSQYQFWLAQDEKLAAAIRQRQAELNTIGSQVTKLKETIQLTKEQVADYEKMLTKKGISKHAYYEKKQNLINYSNELVSQESRLVELKEAIIQQEKERSLLTYQLERDILDQLRNAKEQKQQFLADREKAKKRQQFEELTAPTSGTVQQLAVHTVGGVVSHAQALMIIVPENDSMEVEALVPNKDIGFVEAGQDVVVKIESFPYTRYGYITGKVQSVSFDAIEHEQLGLVFQAIIKLDKDYLIVNDKKVQLTAGMNTTAEIKIGKRRVITYFLSPLQTKVQESMREQ